MHTLQTPEGSDRCSCCPSPSLTMIRVFILCMRPSRKHACHRLSGVPCHRTLPTARASTRGGPYGSNQCVLCHARPPKRQTATGTNSQYLGRDVSYLPSFASFLTRVQCVSPLHSLFACTTCCGHHFPCSISSPSVNAGLYFLTPD